MKLGRSLVLSFALMAAALVVPGACGTEGLVGGSCRGGLSICQNRCVDFKTDENNCGKCGTRCDKGVSCLNGFCGGGGEGFGGFGGDADAGSANHGQYAGNSGTGQSTGGKGGTIVEFDGGLGGNAGAGTLGGGGNGGATGGGSGLCSPPYDSVDHCGSCNTVCAEPTPVCTPIGNSQYECQISCEEPLVNCASTCVDLNSDSDHCGACGQACPSAICQGGKCVGAKAGHIVSVCMNYREISATSQSTTLIGNAVLIPLTNPVKILAFSQYADVTVRSRVDTAITWAAQNRGRTVPTITTVNNPDDVNSRLKKPDYDVFLIYDQQAAPAGVLGDYGAQWQKTLESFSYVGGIVLALDGNTGTREMGDLLTNAGILPVSAQSTVSRTDIFVRAAGDIIGANLTSPFRAPLDSCVFTTSAVEDSTTTFVVTDNPATVSARRPVVVHRTAIPKLN